MILTGHTETAKAALLSKAARVAKSNELLVSHIPVSSGSSIARLLYPEILALLQQLSTLEEASVTATQGLRRLHGFAKAYKLGSNDFSAVHEPELGLADSGILEHDMPELFDAIGLAAQAAASGWALLVDELHCLPQQDLSALIAALHRASQDALPILLIGTAQPHITRLAGDAKPYAERLFQFLPINEAT